MMRAEWDWRGAKKAFRRSIELSNNNSAAHAGLSTLYVALGRNAEAVSAMQTACQMDPRSAGLRSDLARTDHFAHQFDRPPPLHSKRSISIPGLLPPTGNAQKPCPLSIDFPKRFWFSFPFLLVLGGTEMKSTNPQLYSRRRYAEMSPHLATLLAFAIRAQASNQSDFLEPRGNTFTLCRPNRVK
jgi:hypothetical protein